MTVRLGFLGLGEAGHSIAKGLKGAGLQEITAHDIKLNVPATAGLIGARAEDAGVALVQGAVGVAAAADVVIAAVTSADSLTAARDIAPYLEPRHIYVDINSTAPGTKEEAGRIVGASGARYVDAAVMDVVPRHAQRVPMLLGGSGAAEFARLMAPFGMRLEVVSDRVGPASATKVFRSIVMKGLDALLLECLLASSRYGVDERVLLSAGQSFPGLDWVKVAHYLTGRTAVHGLRRYHEMEEVAATLESMEIEPIMANAIAHRFRWGTERGLPRKFAGRVPEHYQEVVAALEEATGAGLNIRR